MSGIWENGRESLKKLGFAKETIARLQSRQNQLKLIYLVEQSYFSVVSAREEMRIAQLSEIYLQHHLTITQKLFNLGQINRLDLYFTQSELSSAREKVLAAKSEIDVWQIRLSNLTGLTISANDSLITLNEFSLTRNLSVDTLIAAALRYNPAISILNQQIKIVNLQQKLIQTSRLPKIYFGGGYILDNDPTSGGNYAAIRGGLQFPILDWGMRKNKAQAFQLQAESVEETREAFLIELR
ncbi:MAG: TolC family protein, partial [bacterium]